MKNVPRELVKEHTEEVVIDITMELFKKNMADLVMEINRELV